MAVERSEPVINAEEFVQYQRRSEELRDQLQASLSRLGHSLDANDQQILTVLAAQICWEQTILERIKNPLPERHQEARIRTIRFLWIGGSWTEPWKTLVNQQLPGKDPTSADIEDFIKVHMAVALQHLETNDRVKELYQNILDILKAGNYPMEPINRHEADHALVLQLTLLAQLPQMREVYEVKKLVEQLASKPEHRAWQTVIETFFTDSVDTL